MSTSDYYRPAGLPSAGRLETLHALYLHAGSTRVPRTHPEVQGAARRISARIKTLLDAGEPDGYRASAERLTAADDLLRMARDFSRLAADLLGDESRVLHEANEGGSLLAEYAAGCAEADLLLRAAIHDSLRQVA